MFLKESTTEEVAEEFIANTLYSIDNRLVDSDQDAKRLIEYLNTQFEDPKYMFYYKQGKCCLIVNDYKNDMKYVWNSDCGMAAFNNEEEIVFVS
jgi:hypothetical protein